jgi:hypothetical protein
MQLQPRRSQPNRRAAGHLYRPIENKHLPQFLSQIAHRATTACGGTSAGIVDEHPPFGSGVGQRPIDVSAGSGMRDCPAGVVKALQFLQT